MARSPYRQYALGKIIQIGSNTDKLNEVILIYE